MTEYHYDKDPVLVGIDPEVFSKSVVFLYMTRGNDIYHEFVTFLLRQSRLFPKFSCALVQNSWRPATEEMFQLGLESPCEFIHIMDTDIGLRHDTTARLMARDLDVVSSPLYFYDPASNDIHLNVHYTDVLAREYTPRMPDGGVEEIYATAFGSVVVKHRVLETFAQANESFCVWSNFLDEKHKDCSPDTIFFLKCREFGFQIWMDWSVPIGTHHKYARFNSTLAEKFYVQRFFDVVFGPDQKNAMFESPEGREQLKRTLQHHYASGQSGRDASGGNSTEPGEEGPAAADSPPVVREEAGGVPETVGSREASVAADGGSNP
jgi:hypothetical protein